jgi:hypothetical protein
MATAIWLSASLVLCATRKLKFTFPVFAVGAVLSDLFTITVTIVLNVTVPVIWATGSVASVSTIVVSVSISAVVLARREVTTATSRRWRATRPARRATSSWSTLTLTAGIKAPRCRRRSSGPLNLQDIVESTDALIMHFVIRIVRITATLILNESEQTASSSSGCRNIAADKTAVAARFNVRFFGSNVRVRI